MKNVVVIGVVLFMTSASVPAWSAEAEPVKGVMGWDTSALLQVPKVHPTQECPQPGMRAFFYEGLEYKGKPTRVFAYYATPEGQSPAGGWPAVVCAHGGGGTAYPDWVKVWNEHGYAAISMDLEGHFPDQRGHESAGPARSGYFADIGLPDGEQWFYHAVADVMRANSLLRSFPEINANKIGLTGISWGGTIVCTAAGLDSRWAFVVPVYGCGFIYESDNEGIRQWCRKMTPKLFVADLAVRMNLPVLVVARPDLGTINHTALTVEAARSRGLDVAGIVINRYNRDTEDVAQLTAPDEIQRATGVPVWGLVPDDPQTDPAKPHIGEDVLAAVRQMPLGRLLG